MSAPAQFRSAAEAPGERPVEAAETAQLQTPDPLLQVCKMLAERVGFRLSTPGPAPSGPTRAFSLPELCDASGVRHRKVRLRGEWWHSDQGPLLAYRSGAGAAVQPIALFPHRGGYRLFDPGANHSQPVTPAVAADIQPDAFVLYRPLPARSLTLLDLLKAGVHGHRRELGILVAASLCSAGLALLTPLLTRWIVDSSIARQDRTELWQIVAALCAGAVAAALFDLTRALTLLRLKSKTAISLQAALWDRLLAMPVSFFRRYTVGDLASRSMGIDHIQHLLTGDITNALFSSLTALFSLAILFRYSWRLALIATAAALLLGCVTMFLARHQLRHVSALTALNGGLAALVYTLLSNVVKLRLSGAERRGFNKWAARFSAQRKHAVAVRQLANLQAVASLAIAAGAPLLFFAAIAYSSRLSLGVGEFLAFNAAYAQFQAAALAAIAALPTALGFVPTYERMRPILDTPPEARSGQIHVGSVHGEIELRRVSFRYDSGLPVLEDVSLVAHPGEFIAIVGPSGSGKSTCLRLMLGFEQAEAGTVMIDGTSIDALDMQRVRREMGVVTQNGRPLVGDLFHNIIGSLPLTLQDAWEAARFVGLDDEIRSMPMSMFTMVNARGVAFSGGQRQRLLLARAVVRRPRILLLDEATSALDNRTQELIARNLAELGATRVVVAHRLSTIRSADRIYVLDRGRIVEHGSFDDLLRRGGLFARMAERQLL